MGHNEGIKDDMLNAIAAGWILLMSYFAFYGFGHLKGFLNENTNSENSSFIFLDQVNYFFAYPLSRYLHLTVIPSLIGLILLTLEKIGKTAKNRTISPVNLSLLSAAIITIQIVPAMIFETSPFMFIDLANPTWLSDKLMDPWGYAGFTFVFLLGIIVGFFHAVMSWTQNMKSQQVRVNMAVTGGVILLSYFAFVGLWNLGGFFSEYGVKNLDQFLVEYGMIAFLQGPVIRYTHLIAIPGLLGLAHLTISKLQKRIDALADFFGSKSVNVDITYSKLGFISFICIFAQTGFAILIPGVNPTWLSDFVMIPVGYSFFSGSYFLGQILGLIKAVFGGFIFRSDK